MKRRLNAKLMLTAKLGFMLVWRSGLVQMVVTATSVTDCGSICHTHTHTWNVIGEEIAIHIMQLVLFCRGFSSGKRQKFRPCSRFKTSQVWSGWVWGEATYHTRSWSEQANNGSTATAWKRRRTAVNVIAGKLKTKLSVFDTALLVATAAKVTQKSPHF